VGELQRQFASFDEFSLRAVGVFPTTICKASDIRKIRW